MTTSGILQVWWSWWWVEEVESIRVRVEGLVLLEEDLERERRDLKNISMKLWFEWVGGKVADGKCNCLETCEAFADAGSQMAASMRY